MDYILASILHHHSTQLHKVLSYDITCQWSKYLPERLKALPWIVCPQSIGSYVTVIPKLHINAHNPPCPMDYLLNYVNGASCTVSKAIECTHATTGLLSGSTKQMGPGYCHDALDMHWQFWNWQKIVGLGKLITLKSSCLDLTHHLIGSLLYKKLFAVYYCCR